VVGQVRVGPGSDEYGTLQRCCYAQKPKHSKVCSARGRKREPVLTLTPHLILRLYTCRYCDAQFDSSWVSYRTVGEYAPQPRLPKDWSQIRLAYVCPKHKIRVDAK
jgi:hypothetical protein